LCCHSSPLAELAVMAYLARTGGHPNIMSFHEILADELYIYCVMPAFVGGEGTLHARMRPAHCFSSPLFLRCKAHPCQPCSRA
jgi:hypothetical protein